MARLPSQASTYLAGDSQPPNQATCARGEGSGFADGAELGASIIAAGATIMRDATGPLAPDQIRTVKAAQFLRRIAPYLVPDADLIELGPRRS